MDNPNLNEQKYMEALEKGNRDAQKLLDEPDKLEEMLRKFEERLKMVPAVGNVLSKVPLMISLVRSYIRKEYRAIPVGLIVAIISAGLYLLCPIDLIPDAIPVLGLMDDAGVLLTCYKLVESDLKEYEAWRTPKES